MVVERKAKEKNEAWIRELEARDEEEKRYRARKEARRNAANGKPGPGVAGSMVDERERRMGTLEMVNEILYGRRR